MSREAYNGFALLIGADPARSALLEVCAELCDHVRYNAGHAGFALWVGTNQHSGRLASFHASTAQAVSRKIENWSLERSLEIGHSLVIAQTTQAHGLQANTYASVRVEPYGSAGRAWAAPIVDRGLSTFEPIIAPPPLVPVTPQAALNGGLTH